MKMMRIVREYRFRQRTFYDWLLETGLAVKNEGNYEIGPNALEGMETYQSKILNANGEIEDITQVIIKNSQVEKLVEMYRNSGKDELYSDLYYKERREKEFQNELIEKLFDLENRVQIIEKQLNKATSLT